MAGTAARQRGQKRAPRAAAGGTPSHALVRNPRAGAALAPEVRAEMEARFGEPFDDVRVHDDADAHANAAALHAKAYTIGTDVVFSAERYAPHSAAGKRLLAHELAHVVQQRRGGAPPAAQSPGERQAIEASADAAAGAIAGSGPITVGGAAAPGLARKGDDDFEDDDPRREQRNREKQRDQQRQQERKQARGGMQEAEGARAKRVVDAMMNDVRAGKHANLSPDKKLALLKRFKAALKGTRMPQLAKNKLQGQFDEALRTPRTNIRGKPQTKWVAGGQEMPFMDLPPGKSKYAQPDVSKTVTQPQGARRGHFNYKSDTLEGLSQSQARDRGRRYAAQVKRNSRHLPNKEPIIVDFAEPGTPEVREEIMKQVFEGSPADEVRFHTSKVTRAQWEAAQSARGQTPAKPKTKAKTKKAGKAKKAAKPKKSAKKPVKKKSAQKKKPARKAKAKKPVADSPPKEKTAIEPAKQPAATDKPAVESKVTDPPAKAPEPAKVVEPAKTPTVEVHPTVTPEAPTAPPVEHAPTTGGKVAGGAFAIAGFLGAIPAIKDIKREWEEGSKLTAVRKGGELGLSFVPQLAPLFLAKGAIGNYWGPRHEAIQKDAFKVGEAVEGFVEDIPLVGRIPYLPKVAGALEAANVAVNESIAYTVKDIGEAIGEGAEDLYDWLTEPVVSEEELQQLLKQMQAD
ncbi:MAG: DUF4157 domain-containing protein [Sulfurifustis sp.]